MIFSMRSKLFLKGILGPGATPESQITEYKKNASKKRGEHEIQQFSEQLPPPQYLLKFEDISPNWDSRLKEKWPPLFSLTWFKWYLELKRTSKCIVGEAYGYSSSYIQSCRECDEIGWKFMYYYTINSRKKTELNRIRFVKHWNEIHLSPKDITRKT